MKRIISWISVLIACLTLCGCQGNYATMDFKEAIEIGEDGIVEKQVFEQLKSENAIGNFVGECNDLQYEWTFFGSDISEAKDSNLLLTIEKMEDGVKIVFAEESVGFPAFLSVYLNEKWNTSNALLYYNDEPVSTVSVTGSKNTILNIPVNLMQGEYIVKADVKAPEEPIEALSSTELLVDNAGVRNTDIVISHKDEYLSGVKDNSNRVYSGGDETQKDKYETDPVPEGKPMPVEPENQQIITEKTYTCIFSIECSTILNNLGNLEVNKLELVPSNGVILAPTEVTFYEGESVFDVLKRVCQEKGIHMEASWTPIYNSAYVEGIHNLYEFDCGELSGWVYCVNGWYPNYGSSRYQLVQGETVEWRYTCDLGRDVGCDWME